MSIVSGVVVFVLVWWVVLFAVLPWGVETADDPAPGTAASAPTAPRIKAKMLATTVISAVIWSVIYLAITYSGFSFRDWAKTM